MSNTPISTTGRIDATVEALPTMISERVTSTRAMDGLSAEWSILARHAGPISQYVWGRACMETFATPEDLDLVTVRRGGELVGLAPLVTRPYHGVIHRILPGVQELHEPMDLLYRDREALEQLAESFMRDGRPLFFYRIPADSPTVECFLRLKRRAVVLQRPQHGCPYIPLDEEWLVPEQKINAGRQSDLRRAQRRAEGIGPLTYQVLRPSLEALPELLHTAWQIEARSWKGEARTAVLHDNELAPFYERYAQAACREGILRLCFLRIGDRPAAMQIAVETAGAFWLLKIGYDEEFARCSPGVLLMCHTIRYAAEQGLRSYEFLGRSAPWIEVWTRHVRPCASLRVYPAGGRAMAALVGEAASSLLYRWRQK